MKKRVIQSFALMQLILCFVSILVFFGMSFFTEDQTSLIICQIFIFLSPENLISVSLGYYQKLPQN